MAIKTRFRTKLKPIPTVFLAQYKNANLKQLVKIGNEVLKDSNSIVPVDEGILKASGYVESSSIKDKNVVVIGYTANYAIFVHEDLEARHTEGQEALFLQKALMKNRNISKILKNSLRKLLKKIK